MNMTKIELILKETDSLHSDELLILIQKLLNRIKKSESTLKLIQEHKGIGKGLWKNDAQNYVNESRSDV